MRPTLSLALLVASLAAPIASIPAAPDEGGEAAENDAGTVEGTVPGTEWEDHGPVESRVLAPDAVAPGTTAYLGFQVRLDPGWHVYWKNPGDAGFPPVVEIGGDPPPNAVELLFPAPERFTVAGGLEALGYEGEVVYPIRIELPEGVADPAVLRVEIDFLACEEECLPFRRTAHLEIPTAPSPGESPVAPAVRSWLDRVPTPVAESPLDVEVDLSRDELVVTLSARGLEAADAELFLEPLDGVDVEPATRSAAPGEVQFGVPARAATAGGEIPSPLAVGWVVTGLGGSGIPDAVAGRSTVTVSHPSAPAGGGPAPPRPGAGELLLAGLLLALTPSSLALVLLELLGSHAGERSALGSESLVWPVVAGAFGGFVVVALFAHGASVALAGGSVVDRPVTVAAVGLLHLVLALLFWMAPGESSAFDPGAARSVGLGFVAAVAALSWAPLSPAAGALVAGVRFPWLAPVAGAGFAVPFLLAALASTAGPIRPGPSTVRFLGFLPLASLVWVSYLLIDTVPAHRLAGIQLAWLAVALGVRMSTTSKSGRARIAARAVALAGGLVSVLLASG